MGLVVRLYTRVLRCSLRWRTFAKAKPPAPLLTFDGLGSEVGPDGRSVANCERLNAEGVRCSSDQVPNPQPSLPAAPHIHRHHFAHSCNQKKSKDNITVTLSHPEPISFLLCAGVRADLARGQCAGRSPCSPPAARWETAALPRTR